MNYFKTAQYWSILCCKYRQKFRFVMNKRDFATESVDFEVSISHTTLQKMCVYIRLEICTVKIRDIATGNLYCKMY